MWLWARIPSGVRMSLCERCVFFFFIKRSLRLADHPSRTILSIVARLSECDRGGFAPPGVVVLSFTSYCTEYRVVLSLPYKNCPYNIIILTYCMVQSPSWEANWFAASQEVPRISQNPKVHYRTHKRPTPVSILGQPNPVHIPTSHLLEIHRNIIHPSTPRSPQWSPSLRFPHQDPLDPLSSPIRATCPA